MEEADHISKILKETIHSLNTENSLRLKHLSDQTIHSASIHQHTDYIIVAVIIYATGKILDKKNQFPQKTWKKFVQKFNSAISLAINALENKNQKAFLKHMENARKKIQNFSISLKPLTEEVLKKASINKATKIYEHGISLQKTAQLLGITQWDLSEYVGQKESIYNKYNLTKNIKARAKMTEEFFNK